jgi:low affinity Fe/Cu permease
MLSNLPVGHADDESGHPHKQGAREIFRVFASKTATAVGSPWAFLLAVITIVAWAITGPMFKYSDTWQLVINTGTTIVTFLMVFLIQNTQNRDARAIHLKLDELIKAKKGARNKLVDLEECSDEEIEQLEQEFRSFREKRRPDQNTTINSAKRENHVQDAPRGGRFIGRVEGNTGRST